MASPAERLFEGRHVDPSAVSVPAGFRLEAAATGLNNPSDVDFDEEGNIFVTEMGSPSGSAYYHGRLVRVRPDGSIAIVADGFEGSLMGIAFYQAGFFVTEHAVSSRIYRIFEDDTREIVLDGIPGGGDHPISNVVVSHSERLYFGQGTRTNSGVVGPDNHWLASNPELCDIPGGDIVLTGENFESDNPFGEDTALTGAFRPFGTPSVEGESIQGRTCCSGGIMRIDPDGGELELFAWGFRRPLGLSVHADGRIYCTDLGMDDRGSRGVADERSYLWHVERGGWYGWPDFAGGEAVTDRRFRSESGRQPECLIANHPPLAERPIAILPKGIRIAGFEFSRSPLFGDDNIGFAALMGDSDGAVGAKIVAIDIINGHVEDFLTNKHPGPASLRRSGGIERPISVRFDRTGEVMYFLDAGMIEPGADRTLSHTGVLWRVVPEIYR